MKRTAGANFVPVSLEDIEKFLKRAFRVMRPMTRRTFHGIVFLRLPIDNWAAVEVNTGTVEGHTTGRDVGEDSIQVMLVGPRGALAPRGAFTRIHRTQNWRDALKDRIEKALDLYEKRQEEWEERRRQQ